MQLLSVFPVPGHYHCPSALFTDQIQTPWKVDKSFSAFGLSLLYLGRAINHPVLSLFVPVCNTCVSSWGFQCRKKPHKLISEITQLLAGEVPHVGAIPSCLRSWDARHTPPPEPGFPQPWGKEPFEATRHLTHFSQRHGDNGNWKPSRSLSFCCLWRGLGWIVHMQMCMEEAGEWISKAECQELVYLGQEEREWAFSVSQFGILWVYLDIWVCDWAFPLASGLWGGAAHSLCSARLSWAGTVMLRWSRCCLHVHDLAFLTVWGWTHEDLLKQPYVYKNNKNKKPQNPN